MKNINTLMLLLFFTVIASAQTLEKDGIDDHETSHHRAEDIDVESRAMMYADKVTTRLSLSLQQKEMIKEAQIKRLTQQRKLHSEMLSSGKSFEDNKEGQDSRKTIQEDFKKSMKQILTPAQYGKWEPMHHRDMKMHSKKAYKMEHKEMHNKEKGKQDKGKDKHSKHEKMG